MKGQTILLIALMMICGCIETIRLPSTTTTTSVPSIQTTIANNAPTTTVRISGVEDILANDPLSLVGRQVKVVGTVNVVKEGTICGGNCVRVNTIEGTNKRKFMPLFGRIVNVSDDGKLIQAEGTIIETPKGTIPDFDYFGERPPISLNLSTYEIIGNTYCDDDSDCVPGGCGHPTDCFNRYWQERLLGNDCSGIVSSGECRDCPNCKCIDNTCTKIGFLKYDEIKKCC